MKYCEMRVRLLHTPPLSRCGGGWITSSALGAEARGFKSHHLDQLIIPV